MFRKIFAHVIIHAYRYIVGRFRRSVISSQTLMATLLGHSGSIFTTMSYSNVVINYMMDVRNFEPDHVLLLQKLTDELHLLRQEFTDLKRRTVAPVEIEEVSTQFGIDSYDSETNDPRENYWIFPRVNEAGHAFYTYVHRHNRGRYQGDTIKKQTLSRDLIMNNYKAKLQSIGLKVTADPS